MKNPRKPARTIIVYFVAALLVWMPVSISLQRYPPKPTGPHAVGRLSRLWIDISRPEILTDDPDDYREIPVEIWYPAEAGNGEATPYFPDLDQLAQGLAASGEVSPLEVFGLRFMKSHERYNASVSREADPCPIILFSPGNGTNVEFYAGIAEELASHGYIVIGINHPYDVAAVALQNGSVARFIEGPLEMQVRREWVAGRIDVRTDDILFVLKKLKELTMSNDPILARHLDTSRVAVMGHSLGGIAAAEACRANSLLQACLNLDGLQIGGPFSASETPPQVPLPNQPFMMITKEAELHPAIISLFEALPSESYRVVIDNATHENFTDGPVLIPSFLPIPDQSDQILALTRKYTLAFFDQTLRQAESPLLEESFQDMQTRLEVYSPP